MEHDVDLYVPLRRAIRLIDVWIWPANYGAFGGIVGFIVGLSQRLASPSSRGSGKHIGTTVTTRGTTLRTVKTILTLLIQCEISSTWTKAMQSSRDNNEESIQDTHAQLPNLLQ